MDNREKLILTKLGHGFYEFSFDNRIFGKLLFKNGEWKHWYSNAVLQEEGKYTIVTIKRKNKTLDNEIKKSGKDGKWFMYSKFDASIVSEESYKNGEKSGTWKYYYPGGQIVSSEINYKNGILDGAFKSYSRTGIPTSEVNYKKSVKHGDTVIFDKNGKEIKRIKFKDGFKVVKTGTRYSPY